MFSGVMYFFKNTSYPGIFRTNNRDLTKFSILIYSGVKFLFTSLGTENIFDYLFLILPNNVVKMSVFFLNLFEGIGRVSL